jgi:Flp pilus assembly protein TadD
MLEARAVFWAGGCSWAASGLLWIMLLAAVGTGINSLRLPTDSSILWDDPSPGWTPGQLRQALHVEPWQPDYGYHLARLLADGDAASERRLERSLYWQPLDPRFWILKGQMLSSQGRIGEAASAMKKALALDPQRAESFFDVGIWRLGLSQVLPEPQAGAQAVLAEIALRKALSLWPEWRRDAAVAAPLADLLAGRGAVEEAAEIMGRLSTPHIQELAPGLWLMTLALMSRTGEEKRAFSLWETRWPGLSLGLDELERLWGDMGHGVISTPFERYMYARIAQRLGHWESAAEIFAELAAKSPDDPRYYLALGEIWERMGRSQEALAAYEKVLELDPMHPTARAYLVHHYGKPRVLKGEKRKSTPLVR